MATKDEENNKVYPTDGPFVFFQSQPVLGYKIFLPRRQQWLDEVDSCAKRRKKCSGCPGEEKKMATRNCSCLDRIEMEVKELNKVR